MKPLNRKQREHLSVLTRRFEYITTDKPGRPADPDYIPGEAQALGWVIDFLGDVEAPVEVRLEMLDRRLRSLESRLGNLERDLEFEEEEATRT